MTEKELLIEKHGLFFENGCWYSQKENAHKHLIVRDSFLQRTDTIGLLFRIHKLCMAKVKYFRAHIDHFEPLRYHYREGFYGVPLWDAEFFGHSASGMILDFRYLQSITIYDDFVALCKELESYERSGVPATWKG